MRATWDPMVASALRQYVRELPPITNQADPKEVKRALRHSTLQITPEAYVLFWPCRERRREP